MKKLLLRSILLVLVSLSSLQAQTSKPTKAETAAFVIDYLTSFSASCPSGRKSFYHNKQASFNDDYSVLTYSYDFTYTYKGNEFYPDKKFTESNILMIELRNIEAIDQETFIDYGFDCATTHAILKTKPGSYNLSYSWGGSNIGANPTRPTNPYKLRKTFIPIASGCIECKKGDTTKLIQAFNHLRKLNGAPEPISFDGD